LAAEAIEVCSPRKGGYDQDDDEGAGRRCGGRAGGGGVAAVVRYRQGQMPDPDERARLDELEARLQEVEVEEPDRNVAATTVGRVLQDLHRNQGISTARLRRWIGRLRGGTLSSEQASVAESDFDTLEREADQRGA
jgi:hypothetical protein